MEIATPRLALLAVQSATTAVSFHPNWEEGHLTLARCQLQMGEVALAVTSFQKAADLDSQNRFPEIQRELMEAQVSHSLITIAIPITTTPPPHNTTHHTHLYYTFSTQ